MERKTMKKMVTALLLLAITSTQAVCLEQKQETEKQETWLTVFVHGIISVAPVLSFKTMKQIKCDQIENTLYEAYVTNMRQNTFVCENQAMQEIGLKKIDTTRTDALNGCPAIAKLFDMQYEWINPNIKNYYYTFGWSGFLNASKRYNDAKVFHASLSKELKTFQAKGIYPKIRLIGFSHGGSICFNLASVVKREQIKNSFKVDELILLGMPIMETSYQCINNEVFKKIYNFYSGSDRVQVLDFSNPGKMFSRRKFKIGKTATFPDNLFQIKTDIFRHVPRKSRLDRHKTASSGLKKPVSRHSSIIRKCSPGHCEWWFFGWTNKYYRDTFALAPLPFVAIIPTLTAELNNIKIKPKRTKRAGNFLRLKLRPFEESMLFETKENKAQLSFLANGKLKLLQDTTKTFPFKKVTNNEYSKKIEATIKQAKEQIVQYKTNKPPLKKRRRHRRV